MSDEHSVQATDASRSDIRVALATHRVHSVPPYGSRYTLGKVHQDRIAWTGYRMELGKRTRAAVLKMRGMKGAQKRFLVVSRPRSGSTLLVDLLRQVDQLRCDGEMLHFGVSNPARLLSALARTCTQESYGCKVLSYQLFEIQKMRDPVGFFEEVIADGFKLVHLRRDTFSQSLSLSKALDTGVYVSWQDGPARQAPSELHVSESGFRKQLEWNAAMLDYEDLLMSALPHDVVQYETDLSSPEAQQSTVDRICKMIGHPSGPVSARTKRTSGSGPVTQVTNLAELRKIADDLGVT